MKLGPAAGMLAMALTAALVGCESTAEPVTAPVNMPVSEDPARYGTWAWDGSTWTQLAPTSFGEHNRGGELYPAGLDYWNGLGGLIALAWPFPFDPADWANVEMWNGSGWVRDDAFPSAPPNVGDLAPSAGRLGARLIFDQANDQLAFFDPNVQTIWVWSHGTWVAVVSPERWPLPKAFEVHSAAYDPYRQEVLILMCCQPASGPVDDSKPCSYGPCNETWAWNGHALTQLSPTLIPNDINYLVPDSSGHMLAFGHEQDLSWDGRAWSALASGLACPKSSAHTAALDMVYDVADKQLIAIGTDADYVFHMWQWVEGAWTQLSPASAPPRGLDSIVFDPMLPGLVLTVEPPPSGSLHGACSS